MSRKLTASTLCALGILAVAGFAQPPTAVDPKKEEKKSQPAPKKAVDPIDGLIGAALANDADVKMAHAKLQLADAELARARQLVSQKVLALDSAVREQKKLVTTAEQMFNISNEHYKRASGSFLDMLMAREKLEVAQAKLAQLETELRLMTGTGRVAAADGWGDLNAIHRNVTGNASCIACHQAPLGGKPATAEDQHGRLALAWFNTRALQSPVGPISDRIRTALDKVVKLGPKDTSVPFEKALEIFKKEAGLDVPVRISLTPQVAVPEIKSLGEELPVGAWLQLYADVSGGGVLIVREYGLLFAQKGAAPPDAVTVHDFWKQKPEKKSGTDPSAPK